MRICGWSRPMVLQRIWHNMRSSPLFRTKHRKASLDYERELVRSKEVEIWRSWWRMWLLVPSWKMAMGHRWKRSTARSIKYSSVRGDHSSSISCNMEIFCGWRHESAPDIATVSTRLDIQRDNGVCFRQKTLGSASIP